MATQQQLPYESRDSSSDAKGKSKASSFELLDRLDGFPVLGSLYRTSTYVYGATKNFNGFTRISFEVFEAPVKVVAAHVDDNYGASLKRADEFACSQLDKAGNAVKQRLPNLEKLAADIRRGPEGILQVGERVVDQVLPPTKGKKSTDRPAPIPPRNNIYRAARLGAIVADRLIERFIILVQALLALFLVTASSVPKKVKSKVQAKSRSAKSLLEFFLVQISQLLPFLNPFYTFRVVKYYVILFVIPTDPASLKKKKEAEVDEKEDEEEDEEESQEAPKDGEAPGSEAPKVEVSKNGRKRRNRD